MKLMLIGLISYISDIEFLRNVPNFAKNATATKITEADHPPIED